MPAVEPGIPARRKETHEQHTTQEIRETYRNPRPFPGGKDAALYGRHGCLPLRSHRTASSISEFGLNQKPGECLATKRHKKHKRDDREPEENFVDCSPPGVSPPSPATFLLRLLCLFVANLSAFTRCAFSVWDASGCPAIKTARADATALPHPAFQESSADLQHPPTPRNSPSPPLDQDR